MNHICPTCGKKTTWNKIDWNQICNDFNEEYETNFNNPVEMMKALQEEHSRIHLSEIFGISEITIGKFCKDNNIKPIPKHRRNIAEVITITRSKMVCEKCGLWFSDDSIYKIDGQYFCIRCKKQMKIINDFLLEHNVTMELLTGKAKLSTLCELRGKIWSQLFAAGFSSGEIAKVFKRCQPTVMRKIKLYDKKNKV